MRILVVGLGAVGTVFACLLKEQGHRVAGIDLDPVVDTVRQQGVRVTGVWGDHAVGLDELATGAEEIQDREFDLVILTVKSFNTEQVAARLAGLIGPHTRIYLAQNGYGNYEAAARSIPEKQIILGVVMFGAETLAPGSSRVTAVGGNTALGSPKNLVDNQVLQELTHMINDAGIPAQASERMMEHVWYKLIYNLVMNPLGAILEVNNGKLAAVEHSRLLMTGIIRETFGVLEAMGQKTLWSDVEDCLQDFYGRLVPASAAHHASMLQDIQRRRKTEIDSLNGAVVELGKRYGVSTPVNEVITELAKAKENLILNT